MFRWPMSRSRRTQVLQAAGGAAALLLGAAHYMAWAPSAMPADFDGLTERQKLILQGAGVWNRPLVELD